ncbi:DUF6629 family protein [Poseidonibacter antarcticus]|uniref:DUF6629 family protein n=1 Tax=Poseidonibacter antarcticus TaxID=2478538 RepID=UPI000EF4B133|nr:DUF6629 family protein [Poseidonibacter antarcticus]
MDIYFAILNFTLSGAIGFIGILTLRQSSTSNEVLFAALPLLFALHQFTEGFVWLGVGGYIEARALELASGIFIYYAQGLLPFIIPLSIYLIEKDSKRKKLLAILSTLGLFLAIYTMYGFYQSPSSVEVVNNTLYYSHPWTENIYDASIYILTTCGSLMLSTSISVQIFGLLNFIGLVIIFLLRPYGFTSLWCFYAAVISTLLYFYFSERRIKFLLDIKEKKNEFSNKLEKELNTLNKRRISILKRVKNS